jgi:hypothetical protein
VVVAVAIVGVMEVAGDEVVGVVAVGDRLVAAAGAVDVAGFVAGAGVGLAALGVGGADFDGALVHVPIVGVVEVAVVEVVDVIAVADSGVAAARAVNVIVSRVYRMFHFRFSSLLVCVHSRGRAR